MEFIDAGANLLDSMYMGNYHSKARHEPDLDLVLGRAFEHGVGKIITLSGSVDESVKTLELIEESNGAREGSLIFGTVGIHPTRTAQTFATRQGDEWKILPDAEQREIIRQLAALADEGKRSGKVVAIGEVGLDYARLQFSPKELQHVGLKAQLTVAAETNLPLYLHNRDSGEDLFRILDAYKDRLSNEDGFIRGIVHSFDEGIDVARKFMSLGLYIGVNGCSLKTEDNLKVVEQIPLEKLILETDCPWCDVRPSHAGFKFIQTQPLPTKKNKHYSRDLGGFCVKNRTEPCHVRQIAEIVCGIKGVSLEEVVVQNALNVHDLFGI
ncbi:hypothetical protein THAOC_09820 [Thalassiosira oceanica]|uniref:TatD related DNase n=1 Tax=Thalassiosira oceanica TaxID=159749 RepID=K0SRN4_THAOC|nr:hypothetical protein THAOC_09820 [Thalassiosira oceanica]|eukprot:EJK68968.1 hypothetical protein THAOC_09820 [Thalassiosira oceanica]